MKTASTLLLAAALVGGSAGGRVLQDVPEVGLGPTHSPEPSTTFAEESSTSVLNEDELVEALESDDQVTGKIKYFRRILHNTSKRVQPHSLTRSVHRLPSRLAA